VTLLAMGRSRPGTVGERDRLVHLFEVCPGEKVEERITALCGSKFHPADLEFLGRVIGMPCELCLRRSPDPAPRSEPRPHVGALLADLYESLDPTDLLACQVSALDATAQEAGRPA
jgi:hypothetical protein